MTESIINKISIPFCQAKCHFKAIDEEREWRGKIVHLITGVLECIFPINYLIALFDRSVFKEPPRQLKPIPVPIKADGENPTIIGIDLGTTNSCVAVMKNGVVEVIPDSNGARTTPSIASFKGEGNQSETALYSTKRFIGRKYDEIEAEAKNVSYKVIKNANGDAAFDVGGKIVTPEDAGAQILAKMKRIAEAHLGKKITKAVVTVPAYFNDAQRQATREAGRIAGLDVVRIIAEPTAAALAYGIDKQNTSKQNIAVYDLGGGTFDVSILNIDNGTFEVRSTNGDTHLGGDDFDQAIVNWIAAQTQTDLSKDKKALQVIRDAAVKAKIELSTLDTAQIDLSIASKKHTLTLTRAKLEELCRELVERSIEPCSKAMKDADLSKKKIDHAILVGGMTRMPAVRKTVEKIFNRAPNHSVNPDEAVAFGAAIQAAVIAGDINNVLLVDVAPLTLGIEVEGGILQPLIKRNTSIPTKATQTFSTATDKQSKVKISIYQGERKMALDNKLIGRFELTGIPPAPRGMPQIEVTFEINADGILKVHGQDKLTGKEQKIQIASKSSLSKEGVEDIVQQAAVHEAEDQARLELAKVRNKANELIQFVLDRESSSESQTLINSLKKALKGDDIELINAKGQELLNMILKAV